MSTIVVVRKANSVAIAADTLTTFGNTKFTHTYSRDRDKILKFKDNYIGLVGSVAHSNVFSSIIRKHPEVLSFKGLRDIFDTYLKLHPILKERYFLNPSEKKDDDQEYESSQINALIANPYGIFGMFSWREVYEYERFWSIGSGRDYALGAMFGVYDQIETAEEIAIAGVKAGCEFDDSSSLPYTIYSMKLIIPKGQTRGHGKERRRAP
jgi:ATP-dependent HslUV protease, peptidase subunit HslV